MRTVNFSLEDAATVAVGGSVPGGTLVTLLRQGVVTLYVDGDCMNSVAPRGSLIRVEPRRWYAPGDVVTILRRSGDMVTHRLVGYLPGPGGWRVLTKADGALMADAPAPLDHVVGRVIAVGSQPYRPTLAARLRALLAWPGAMFGWMGERFAG